MSDIRQMAAWRLPADLLQRLKAAAAIDRRSVTKAVEQAIEDYCRRVEREARRRNERGAA